MVIKCPNCDGSLQYDAPTGRLLCPYCSSSFDVREFDRVGSEAGDGGQENTTKNSAKNATENTAGAGNGQNRDDAQFHGGAQSDAEKQADGDDTMDTEIYTCTSCGAELMINNVESATFCAYCGQPTIVFSRISKMKKPKYILPFSITKEQAHNIIRTHFRNGQYIPESVKNFQPELIRGIYIPFMLYDVKYYDRQLIKSVHKQGKSSTTYYHYREASNHFTNITVDSSVNFNDESSQRLEPYDLSNIQPFNPSYLSGYYADCMDDDQQRLGATALQRSKLLFDEAVLRTVSGSSKSIIENNPTVDITNADYVMLPVWFLVFNEGEHHHTILVNGQTGKTVGAVPCDWKKAKTNAIVFSFFFSVVFSCFLSIFFSFFGVDDSTKMGAFFLFLIGFLAFYIWSQYKEFKRSQELTTAGMIRHLASDRQEG